MGGRTIRVTATVRRRRGLVALLTLLVVSLVAAPASSAAAKVTLSFITSAQTVAAGATSGTITVRLTGSSGPATVSLSSTSGGGTFFDATGSQSTSVAIPSGQTTASFSYRDTRAGFPSVTATAQAQNHQFNGKPSATQQETITAGALDHLGLSPASASVNPGQSRTYTATGLDAYGNTLAVVTASTTFSIAPDGSCAGAACSSSVPGAHTVTGNDGGKIGTATLNVTVGSATHITITPASSARPVGQSQSYTVTALDRFNKSLGNVTAMTTFSIAPDGSCNGGNCSAAQAGVHTVTATYGSLTATSSLAATSTCRTSGPSGGAYTLTLCLSPVDGSTVTGTQPVAATLTVNGVDPHTAKVIFYLDGQYLLTDFQGPSSYTFLLSSARWVDGSHTLQAQAIERDGFTSEPAAVSLTFANGVTSPPGTTGGFTPNPGAAPPAGQPFVLAAVGDGAGGENGETSVTNLIAGWNPNLFLYLGDVYEKGTTTEFSNWYGTAGGSFFGQFRAITDPTIGNHEYTAGQAPGYFDYWNKPPDYYSVNTPVGWHLVSLNSNLDGSAGSAQYTWLQQDLANNTQPCTLVYFHHPLFNIGPEPVPARFTAVWPLLAQHGVDLVLNGHDHDYQRWVPMDGNGNADPSGPTEFVVGTGGHSLQSFIMNDPRVANSLSGSFGALRLDLNPGGASYRYVTAAGTTVDSGGVTCDPAGADNSPPSTPSGLAATTVAQTSISPGVVNLSWSASTDNVGVTSYKVYRDGQQIATVGAQTSYGDQTVAAAATYAYRVQALDAAGNASDLSAPLTVTTPPVAPIFSDGFESGDLTNWSTVSGLGAEQTDVNTGAWASEGIANGAEVAYAWKTLPATLPSAYYQIHFKIVSVASNTLYLGRFRTAYGAPSGSAASILGMYVSTTGKLGIRNDVAATSTTSASTPVSLGVWHTLQVHVTIADTSSQIETWFDGAQVPALTLTQSLGVDPIGIVQLGENAAGKTYDVRFDDVAVDTVPLP